MKFLWSCSHSVHRIFKFNKNFIIYFIKLKNLNKNWYSLNQSEVFHYVSSSSILKDWSSAHAHFCSKKQHPIVLLCYNLPSNIGILRNYIPFQSFYCQHLSHSASTRAHRDNFIIWFSLVLFPILSLLEALGSPSPWIWAIFPFVQGHSFQLYLQSSKWWAVSGMTEDT